MRSLSPIPPLDPLQTKGTIKKGCALLAVITPGLDLGFTCPCAPWLLRGVARVATCGGGGWGEGSSRPRRDRFGRHDVGFLALCPSRILKSPSAGRSHDMRAVAKPSTNGNTQLGAAKMVAECGKCDKVPDMRRSSVSVSRVARRWSRSGGVMSRGGWMGMGMGCAGHTAGNLVCAGLDRPLPLARAS